MKHSKKNMLVVSLMLLQAMQSLVAAEGYEVRSSETVEAKKRFKSSSKSLKAKRLERLKNEELMRRVQQQPDFMQDPRVADFLEQQGYKKATDQSAQNEKRFTNAQDAQGPQNNQNQFASNNGININLRFDPNSPLPFFGGSAKPEETKKDKDSPDVQVESADKKDSAKKAAETEKSLEEQIEDNIRARSDFSWKRQNFLTKRIYGDVGQYKDQINAILDSYVAKLGSDIGLFSGQRKELKLALSEGLMRKQENMSTFIDWVTSVTELIGKGKEVVGEAGKIAEKGKLVRGRDVRTHDYRSTMKRLQDVIAQEPLVDLEKRLQLTDRQKAKLAKVSNELRTNPEFIKMTKMDARLTKISIYGYKAMNVLMLGLIVTAIVEIWQNKDKITGMF